MRLSILVLLGLSLSIVSCKKEQPKHGVPPSEQVIDDLNKTKTAVEVKFSNENQNLLYNDYLAVKAALVNTNVVKTQITANKMAQDLGSIPEFKNARGVAILIAKEKDIEKQREFFVGLTDEVFKSISNNVVEGQFFQQMCPMAFNGKGAVWLSNSNEIRNPYFGDVMLACGVVTNTFQKK